MKSKGSRGTIALPLTSLLSPAPLVSPILPELAEVLSDVEDFRYYHPLGGNRPASTVRSKRANIGLVDPGSRLRRFPAQTKAIRAFGNTPLERKLDPAAVCVRRKSRREVLHALNRTRKGKGGSPRRNWRSSIKC